MTKRFEVGFVDPKAMIIHKPGVGGLLAAGTTVPANAETDYAPGCIFIKTNGTAGAELYFNQGTATSSLFVAMADLIAMRTGEVVSLTATTAIVRATHANLTLALNASGGFTSTLPASTGSGDIYHFVVGTVSTTGYVVTAAGSDVFKGTLQIVVPGSTYATAGAGESFTSTTNQNITLNGTTKGGVNIGDWFEIQDIAASVWSATGMLSGSGTLATPFS
jgi:hypothetical protein